MAEKQLDLFDRLTPKQLWLMNFQNPLIPRFGKEFFSSLPKTPGVYKMKNERGEIIYVGKAKNLRDRLRSYTRASVDNSSRKVLRLVYLVRSIEWEELESEKAALLRENYLLRTLAPYFNVVNTSPHTYLFVHLTFENGDYGFHLAMAPDPSYPDIYGAFKGLGLCYRTHKALLRLLWFGYNPCPNGFELPPYLTSHRKLSHYRFRFPQEVSEKERRESYAKLRRFFNGTARVFLDELVNTLLEREDLAPFTREFIQSDLETLLEFYERCAKRNRRIKRELKIDEKLLAQDKIDDFLVLLSGK